MCFRDYLNDSISHLSDVCGLIYLCLSIFLNKSVDCCLTQGVDTYESAPSFKVL